MKVEIDSRSGFCFGVVNAIRHAENEMTENDTLYCLGDIVHNSEEVKRLEGLGLKTISHADLDNLSGAKVLIRAHGEPPSTYQKAKEKGIQLVDASCPVVLKLQERVKKGWETMLPKGGQVVIYGKKGHAEVNGLVGQTNGEAIVVEHIEDANAIDFTKPVVLFSQTTKDTEGYEQLAELIRKRMAQHFPANNLPLKVNNTICGQVSNRKRELVAFSQTHDVIIFVSGAKSSNGKMLYEVCLGANPNTYMVTNANDLKPEWFATAQTVGICGATSTPLWLMEKVKEETLKVKSRL